MSNAHVSYHIDQNDCIVSVNDAWDTFALDNDAAELTAQSVLNRPLFDFIVDSGTCEIFRTLLDRCRGENSVFSFPFRCDSPSLRRFMRMEIRPTADEGIEFECRVEREELRDVVVLLDTHIARNAQLIINCGWCKRFKLDDDTWLEAEQAVITLQLFDTTMVPKLSHGICPACRDSLDVQRLAEG